jgi:uncharacterized protein HemX
MENDKTTVSSTVDEPNNKPITQTENNLAKQHKHIKLRTILIVIIVILLVCMGGYGIYYWQHQKVTSLQSQVNSLQSQLKQAQTTKNHNKTKHKKMATPTTPITPTSTTP